MKKKFTPFLRLFVLFSICSLLLTSCSQRRTTEVKGVVTAGTEVENEEEHDKYDGPEQAAAFEIKRTRDLSTGKVPRGEYWKAMEQTQRMKQDFLNSPNATSALSWTERGSNSDAVGPSNGNTRANGGITSGRVRATMVDAADATGKTVWIGGVDGGLWKTTDITASPATWILVNDQMSNLAIAAICQNPTNPAIIYCATGESYFNADAVQGNGVFKSTNGGTTWTQLPTTTNYVSNTRIICDNMGNVYLGTRDNGLLRSTDGGASWINITPTGVSGRICDLEISSTGRLHSVSGIFSAQAYRYTDIPDVVTSGAGWSAPTVAFPSFSQRAEIACNGNTLYAAPCNNSYQVPIIYKSINGGQTWVATGTQPGAGGWASGQGWYNLAVGINEADASQCVVGGLEPYKTTDGGATWVKLANWVGTGGQYVHADIHDIKWYNGGNKMLFACDGGIHYSADNGVTIRDRNVGLRIKQFYSGVLHPTTTNYFLGGAQDNGTHQFNNAGLSSSIEVTGGDGAYCDIDEDQPQFQYGAYVYNQYRRSTNGGSSWGSVNFSGSAGQFINPFDYDDAGNRLYAAYNANQYLRWNDPQTGNSSSVISLTGLGGAIISSVQVSPYTANRVYFGSEGGAIVRVDNAESATPTETQLDLPTMPNGYVNCVNVGTSDQNLIACFANYGISNIWLSTNGGTTWTVIDGNLPNMPVRWAVFYPGDNTKGYIATEAGVWETELFNGASTVWVPSPGFPAVRTDMLDYRTGDRTLLAATHGRGMWTAIIPAPPCTPASVTAQPADASACVGANASFAITATGTGVLTYQWQISTNGGGTFTNLANGAPYSGVTTNTLTITSVTAGLNANQYRCVVTGNCAPLNATSNAATLTIGGAAVINTPPVNTGGCVGANASFSVGASGSGLTYQWQISTNGGGTFTNLANGAPYSGVTTAVLTITGVTAGLNNNQYRCTVGTSCAAGINSAAGILTISSPPAVTGQPASVTLCEAATTSFAVAGTGTSLTYQWQVSTNGGGTFTNLANGGVYSGVTIATLTITGAGLALNGNQYRCVVSGACAPAVNSNAATLTVNAKPLVTQQPAGLTLCAGNTASFTIAATGTGIGYQWQESTNGGGTFTNLANGAFVSGVTTTSLTLTGVTLGMNNNQYRCVVSGTCTPAANSNAAILAVNTGLVISSQPGNNIVCENTNTSFTVGITGFVNTYQWQVSTNGGGTFTNLANGGVYSGVATGTLTLTGVPAGLSGNQYRCVLTGACPSINSNAGTLTVNTAPVITLQPVTSRTICATQGTSFTITATGTAIGYQWQESTNGGVSFTNIANGGVYGGAASGTLTLTGVPVGMNNNQYRCVVSGTCAPAATSGISALTVFTPISISAQPAPRIICANQDASFSVTAAGTSPAYQWQVSTDGGFSFTNITGATLSNYALTNIPFIRNGNFFRCIVSGAAPCAPVTTGNALLTVNPLPLVSLNAAPYTRLYPGLTTTLTATATPASVSYVWTWNTGLLAGVTGTAYPVTVNKLGTYQVTVTDLNGCVNQSNQVTIADSASNKLFLFPSPNNGRFTISYQNRTGTSQVQQIIIYNGYGAKVYFKSFTAIQPYQLHAIDMSNAAAGTYLVVLLDGSGSQLRSGKFMIR
jgi:uncharacterized protein (DUF736 family)